MVEADIDQELRIPKGSSAEIVSDMLGNVKVTCCWLQIRENA